MNKQAIQVISLKGEKKMAYVVSKFMEISGIKEYRALLTVANKILADDINKTQEKETSALKLLNLTAYNELILEQEDTVLYQSF